MKFFNSTFFTVLVVVVIFLVGSSLVKLLPQKGAVDEETAALEDKIKETELSNLKLSEMLDFFKSDAYKEREARLRLNYVKPGEKAAIVYRNKEEEQEKSPERENWLDIFKNLSGFKILKNWISRD